MESLSSMQSLLASILLIGLVAAQASAVEGPSGNEDVCNSIREMQKANYFSFVILVKMVQDRIPSNITFLMPNDRMLSTVTLTENEISSFLARHSIPSTLLFDHLVHFPTGTFIPSCESGFSLRVVNTGRRRFYLNNVRIVSPNICTAGSSIRCHGIDRVLAMTAEDTNGKSPESCFSRSPGVAVSPAPSQPTLPSLPPATPRNTTPAMLSPPSPHFGPPSRSSGSPNLLRGLSKTMTSFLVLLLLEIHI